MVVHPDQERPNYFAIAQQTYYETGEYVNVVGVWTAGTHLMRRRFGRVGGPSEIEDLGPLAPDGVAEIYRRSVDEVFDTWPSELERWNRE
jgi:hypothetical protein